MKDETNFKDLVEAACGIADWSPTPYQLAKLKILFLTNKPTDSASALNLIQSVCGGVLFHAEEGVDNSDIAAALRLAIAAASS